MGLDQYAFARKNGEEVRIGEWRKHANLEGWAANLYSARGGTEVFNCIELQLFRQDILKLAKEHNTLETVGGFFWGNTTVQKTEDTQVFVDTALSMVDDGYQIFYTSWW